MGRPPRAHHLACEQAAVNGWVLKRPDLEGVAFDGQLDFGDRGMLLLRGEGKLDADEPDAVAALRKADYDVEILGDKLAFSLMPQLREMNVQGLASGTVRARGHIEDPAFVRAKQICKV